MGWPFWLMFAAALAGTVVPFLPPARTARWRRFRRLGWVLLPACALAWAGFLALNPAAPAPLYYACFAGVIAVTGALLFAGYVYAKERHDFLKGGGRG